MNSHVNAISNRLSLRPPQRDALEILARLCEIVPLEKGTDAGHALEVIKSEFPTVSAFDRDFISVCFALANRTSQQAVDRHPADRGHPQGRRKIRLQGF